MFLLDTNAVIHFLKGKGRIAENLMASSPGQVGVPSVVLYELQVGVLKSDNPAKKQEILNRFMASMTVYPFSHEEAELAGEIRAELEKKGEPIGPYDVLIAATALANNKILVTNNTKEFRRVDRLQSVDWY